MQPQHKDRIIDMTLSVAPYVLGALVVNQIGIKFGLWDSPKDTKAAKKFRDSPFVVPTYAQENLKALSLQDLASKIFDSNDAYRLNKVNKSVKDTYYAKGYLWDDEESAIRSLKDNIKSLVDLSIYSGIFSNYVQEPFINYIDSFLENKYQAELWKWVQKLPVLTVKEQGLLEKRTGKKVSFSPDKKIIYTSK